MQRVVATDPESGTTLRQWGEHCVVTRAVLGEVGGGDIVLLPSGSPGIDAVPAIPAGTVEKGPTPGTSTQPIEGRQGVSEGDLGEGDA